MRSGETKKLTQSAVVTAMAVLLNCAASVFSTMSYTIIAVSGLLTAYLVSECGLRYAALSYVAASVLCVVLSPDKSCALLFVLLFGAYPIAKSTIEKRARPALALLIKLVYANILLVVVYLLFTRIFLAEPPGNILVYIVGFLIYNFAFVAYDVCMTKLISLYQFLKRYKR